MDFLITASLLVNVAVLAPVCVGLIADAGWTHASYGPDCAARGILLSVYIAIGIVSAVLLAWPESSVVAALLLVQVIYKIMTPITVGTLRNPVVISNLGIAALHCGTLATLWHNVFR